MQIKLQLLRDSAVIPTIATSGSAGYDLYSASENIEIINSGERLLIPTGISLEIPLGYYGAVCSRSGLALKHGLVVLNAPGIVDSDYRGEIKVILYNTAKEPVEIKPKDRIAQLIICPCTKVQWVLSEKLELTERGVNGFGSTGQYPASIQMTKTDRMSI